jgi:hypothetical protein
MNSFIELDLHYLSLLLANFSFFLFLIGQRIALAFSLDPNIEDVPRQTGLLTWCIRPLQRNSCKAMLLWETCLHSFEGVAATMAS